MNAGDLCHVVNETATVYDQPITITGREISRLLELADRHRIGVLAVDESVVFLGEKTPSEFFSGGYFLRVVTRFGVGWIASGVVKLAEI